MNTSKSDDEMELDKCRKMLQADGIQFTEEDVIKTREIFNIIAKMIVTSIFNSDEQTN